MPTVPKLTRVESNPTIANQPLPSQRLNPDAPLEAFGGGASAEAVTAAGQGVLASVKKIADEEQAKADDLATQEAYSKTVTLKNGLFWNQKTGAFLRKGKDAFGITEEYGTQFDKGADEIEKNLGNQTQKQMYKKMRLQQKLELTGNLERHTFTEAQTFDDETTEAGLITTQDDAVLNYQNPGKIQESLDVQKALIISNAQRLGKPAEWVRLKLEDTQSKTHAKVINRMLANGQDLTAKTYFDSVKQELTGADSAVLEKSLEEGTLRGESQRQTDTIMAKTDSRGEALEQAKKIKDPKLRDEVEQRVNQSWTERKQVQKEAQDSLYLQSTNMLDNAGAGAVPRNVIPPNVWSQLSLEQRNALENRTADPQNNDKAFLEFWSMNTTQMAALKQADFETMYWSKFDKTHRTRAENQWKEARDAAANATLNPKYASTLSFKDRVDNTLRTSIIKSNKAASKFTPEEAKTYALFENEAAKQVQEFEKTKLGGKVPASGEEIQKILDDMVVKKVFIDKAWRIDPEKPIGSLTQDERGVSYVPLAKIPQSDIAYIEKLLKTRNKPIEEKKVEQAYAAFLTGDRKRFEDILNQ